MTRTSTRIATLLASLLAGFASTASARPAPTPDPLLETGLDPSVLSLALEAADRAAATVPVERPELLTIIDYSLPSTTPRLWVVDRERRQVLWRELVAHGQGSGENFATAFSNRDESHQTSLGLFLTEDTYVGRNGYSLRLRGLEPGFNDRAKERAIVIHGAPYVSAEFARRHGRLGRSWGCPALGQSVARAVIDSIRGGSLVFAYYPERSWLASSRFLGTQAATAAIARGRK